MLSFCSLTSMEPILIPNCSLLYLHSNDMNSWKKFISEKKVIAINTIDINKNLQIGSTCNRLNIITSESTNTCKSHVLCS